MWEKVKHFDVIWVHAGLEINNDGQSVINEKNYIQLASMGSEKETVVPIPTSDSI